MVERLQHGYENTLPAVPYGSSVQSGKETTSLRSRSLFPFAVSPFPFSLFPSFPSRKRLSAILAVFCACMVLFAATLRVAHSHDTAAQESGHCQICIAIHTAMPAVTAPVHIVLHPAPEPVVTPAPKAPAKVRVEVLSDRAPPAIV